MARQDRLYKAKPSCQELRNVLVVHDQPSDRRAVSLTRSRSSGIVKAVSTNESSYRSGFRECFSRRKVAIREIIPNLFPLRLISNSKQLDFESRTKRLESRGSERNRPFGKIGRSCRSAIHCPNGKWLRILGLIAQEIARRKHCTDRFGGGRGTGIEPSPRITE
jgi:hypothetical protein